MYNHLHLLVRAPPAAILSVSYGYERLEAGSLQTILKQLLGCVDILWDAFHTLMQYP